MYVRYLEVGAVNPLVLDQAEGERIAAGFAQIAASLPDRQSLQLYVQGTPLDSRTCSPRRPKRCERAAGAARRTSASATGDGDPPAGNRPGAVDPKDRADDRAIVLALLGGLSLAPNGTTRPRAIAQAAGAARKDSAHEGDP